MKIAINTCYGGFGISNKAFEKLLDRKGIAFDKVDNEENRTFLGASYFEAGHAGDNDYYLSDYQFCEDRTDPDLIAVIEEMTKDVDGFASDIKIVEIPDDVEWQIDEYDGIEWVAEKHRTWS